MWPCSFRRLWQAARSSQVQMLINQISGGGNNNPGSGAKVRNVLSTGAFGAAESDSTR